jgi:hypothetical protein
MAIFSLLSKRSGVATQPQQDQHGVVLADHEVHDQYDGAANPRIKNRVIPLIFLYCVCIKLPENYFVETAMPIPWIRIDLSYAWD